MWYDLLLDAAEIFYVAGAVCGFAAFLRRNKYGRFFVTKAMWVVSLPFKFAAIVGIIWVFAFGSIAEWLDREWEGWGHW